jgi:hypothetical protein
MSDSPNLPGSHAFPPRSPAEWRALYGFLRDLLRTVSSSTANTASTTALEARVGALEADEGSAGTLSGVRSVRVDGSLESGAQVQLRGDSDSPDPTHYYGTDAAGTKGFHPIADALAAGTAIDLTTDTGGVTEVAHADIANAGGGTFQLIDRTAQGHVHASDGTAADVPYDNTTSGLTAADVQAAIDELASTTGGSGWTIVAKTATTTRTSTAVLADDPHLTVPLVAGEIYIARWRVYFKTANATMDFKYRTNYSGTLATQPRWVWQAAPGFATTPGVGISDAAIGDNALTATTFGLGFAFIDFFGIAPTTDGNWTFQWCQNTSDAGNCQVLLGSYIEYKKIA